MVSILIPTKNRKDLLQRCVDTLFDNSSDIEVLVIMDNGDIPPKDKRIRLFSIARINNLSYYFNYLAKKSKGSHLFVFNDDAYVKTPDFDKIIEDTLTDPVDFGYPTLGTPNGFSWPIMTRRAYELLRFVFHPKWTSYGADQHTMAIFKQAEICKGIPIEVIHDSHHYKLRALDETAINTEKMSNWDYLLRTEQTFEDVDYYAKRLKGQI
uniref:Putative glycosyltransferase n=1 Tax=viral metagenome TaxID=1070528 RepID=A0A6M3KGL7_9ZZZZ